MQYLITHKLSLLYSLQVTPIFESKSINSLWKIFYWCPMSKKYFSHLVSLDSATSLIREGPASISFSTWLIIWLLSPHQSHEFKKPPPAQLWVLDDGLDALPSSHGSWTSIGLLLSISPLTSAQQLINLKFHF